jgi:hypothetical protein
MVKVISLKCVEHNTKPKKITTCINKNKITPDFQAYSCSVSITLRYIFLNKCKKVKITSKSTPRSCNQKKSSVYIFSASSSSRDKGTNIGSVIKEKLNMVPDNN